MADEIQVVAIFNPSPGKENRLKEILLDLASKVHEKEKGVTKYQAFEQVNSPTGANVILFQETYADKAAADIHLSTPYFGAVTDTITKEGLVTKPFELIVMNPIGGFASRL